jgi:3-phosphoshikimate 1-carboxyvinyltransferase
MSVEKIIERFPSGVITPPPSKSVSHRALICAALAGGKVAMDQIFGSGVSDDIAATRAALQSLLGMGATPVIDAAESGSTLRFILPIAGVIGGKWRFKGRGRLMARPMDVYAKVFPSHGCEIEVFPDKNEIKLEGRLSAGYFEIPGNISSQFISGLLFALPLLEGDSEIRLSSPLESADYVRMTLDVMQAFGVAADAACNGWRIRGGQGYRATNYMVEKDWSQAAFFLGAAALGRDVAVAGLSMDSLQGDRRILDILRSMGAEIIEINIGEEEWIRTGMNRKGIVAPSVDRCRRIGTNVSKKGPDAAEMREGRLDAATPVSVLRVIPPIGGLKAIHLDVSEVPDLVPPIAALACFAQGSSRLEGAGRLRLKESDRLAALREELSKLGAAIKEDADSLLIDGRKTLPGGCADAHGDHRIAMAVALAAIRCEGCVTLTGWESVRKSYPDFWQDFEGGRA